VNGSLSHLCMIAWLRVRVRLDSESQALPVVDSDPQPLRLAEVVTIAAPSRARAHTTTSTFQAHGACACSSCGISSNWTRPVITRDMIGLSHDSESDAQLVLASVGTIAVTGPQSLRLQVGLRVQVGHLTNFATKWQASRWPHCYHAVLRCHDPLKLAVIRVRGRGVAMVTPD
jgi:hypothetical protein